MERKIWEIVCEEYKKAEPQTGGVFLRNFPSVYLSCIKRLGKLTSAQDKMVRRAIHIRDDMEYETPFI